MTTTEVQSAQPPPEVAASGVCVRSLGAHFLLLLAWAVLLALAFPHPGWWPLAHVALVPAVVLSVVAAGAWRLAWTTYVLAFFWWLYMIRWLVPVTGGGYAFMAAYLALYMVGVLWLTRLGRARCGTPLVLLLPLVWVALELMRGYVLAGGFGWYALAHSQAPWREGQPPGTLIQCADLFGEGGVSFCVAMTNGLVADWVLFALGRRRGATPQAPDATENRVVVGGGARRIVIASSVWILVHCGTFWYGSHRLAREPQAPPKVRIAVVQTDVPQNNMQSPTAQSQEALWAQIDGLVREAGRIEPPIELVALPESTTPAPINDEAVNLFLQGAKNWAQVSDEQLENRLDPTERQRFATELGVEPERVAEAQSARYRRLAAYAGQVAQLARDIGAPLLIGSVAKSFEDPKWQHNSVYLYHADGARSPARYDKCHLVPFGEFIPWVGRWPWLKDLFIQYLTPYDFDYTVDRGTQLTVFELPAGNAAAGSNINPIQFTTPICFEDTVPRLIRRMMYEGGRKRARMLVSVSNDGWFVGFDESVAHMQMAALRCVENRVPMARSVNTGPSGFVDSGGRIGPLVTVDGRQRQVQGVTAHDVWLDDRMTLFGLWGHLPIMVLLLAVGAFTVGGWLVRRR